MIDCRAVTKSYSSQRVLDNVSLSVKPGICALLGPNGAGKSTLLRLLSGLESPDGGSVEVRGLSFHNRAIEIRSTLGVVPEGLGLFEALSIRENLEAIGPIYGLAKGETEARAADLLRLFDLTYGRNTPARECSFGMRKKTALAMALLYKHSVLLLDEPFEGIDPASSAVIQALLRHLSDHGATILLTSHILPVVQRIASRVLILHQGRIAADYAPPLMPDDIEESYFTAVGIGQPGIPDWLR